MKKEIPKEVEDLIHKNENKLEAVLYAPPAPIGQLSLEGAKSLQEVLSSQPKWDIPEEFAIKSALVGAYITKLANPNQPYTPDELIEQGVDSVEEGACALHIHVRTPEGLHTLNLDLFHQVIDPIKEKYGKNVVIDGCPEGGKNLKEALAPLVEFQRTVEVAPITISAAYWGDGIFVPTKDSAVSHVKAMQGLGIKPEICIHDTNGIDAAKRWIIDTRIYEKPTYWRICIGNPSWSCMLDPSGMIEIYEYFIRQILKVDKDARIMISMAGRGAMWEMIYAALRGPPVIGVRLGMEDSIWMYPHKNTKIPDNPTLVRTFTNILKLMDRRPATADEYRKLIGSEGG